MTNELFRLTLAQAVLTCSLAGCSGSAPTAGPPAPAREAPQADVKVTTDAPAVGPGSKPLVDVKPGGEVRVNVPEGVVERARERRMERKGVPPSTVTP
jgi:hypothetical protein